MINNTERYAMLQMLTERSPRITLHKKTNTKSGKQNNDNKSKSSKSSKSTKTSKPASIENLCKLDIKTKRQITTLNTKTEDMDNEKSDLTDSYDDDKEK